MRHLQKIALVAVIAAPVFISMASPAHAWDHKREGFFLGGALGGFGLWDASASKEFLWVAGAIEIGYAPSDQFLIYYSSRNLIMPALMFSLTLAADYYTEPAAPALFFTGGMGTFGGAIPMAGGYQGDSIYIGIGYEFARYWSIALEGGYTWLESGPEAESWDEMEGPEIRLLVGLTGY